MTETEKFEQYLNLMQQRGDMRIALSEAVKRFNEWNEENFPGQFLPVHLCVTDYQGIRKVQ